MRRGLAVQRPDSPPIRSDMLQPLASTVSNIISTAVAQRQPLAHTRAHTHILARTVPRRTHLSIRGTRGLIREDKSELYPLVDSNRGHPALLHPSETLLPSQEVIAITSNHVPDPTGARIQPTAIRQVTPRGQTLINPPSSAQF